MVRSPSGVAHFPYPAAERKPRARGKAATLARKQGRRKAKPAP